MPIFKRILNYQNANGRLPIEISIEEPAFSKFGWRCNYKINWPGGDREGSGFGIDPIHALTLALHAVGTDIYTSDYHRSGKLFWDKPGQGYGFPVPNTIRDLLIGDDARFFG